MLKMTLRQVFLTTIMGASFYAFTQFAAVYVHYTALVDLSLFKQPLHFHTAASVVY